VAPSPRAFEEEQKLRRQEIVSKILKEEAEEENRKKKQHPSPAKTTNRKTLRDKTWSYISDFCEGKTNVSTYTQASKALPAGAGGMSPKPSVKEAVLRALSLSGVTSL
jgi:hypothetical protein